MGRRKETTEYPKECIADAMLKLMRKTPLEKITAQEITDLAGVGRATYFRYFTSKSDVLVYKLTLLWENWNQKRPYPKEKGDYEKALWFFEFCYSIRSILKLLFKNEQWNTLLTAYLAFISSGQEKNGEDGDNKFLRNYMSYGMLGVVRAWTEDKFREVPEELARICTQM